jgi:ABC-type Fe3+/spermidine/putrescine transport system ATPase subunit
MSISDRIAVMRAGRIEQVGTPTEIYERPATEFAARFVGIANFLDGEVAEASAAGATVRTALGILVVQAAAPWLAAGAKVRLVVRPEAIRLSTTEPPEGAPAVAGKVVGVSYTGAIVRYLVDAGDARLTVDVHNPRHGPRHADGDRVAIQLPGDVQVLPAGPEDR